jgi:hypothetical protein
VLSDGSGEREAIKHVYPVRQVASERHSKLNRRDSNMCFTSGAKIVGASMKPIAVLLCLAADVGEAQSGKQKLEARVLAKESRTSSLGDDESCQTNSRSRDKACWETLIERPIPACPRTIGQAAARKAAALAGA